MLHATHQRMTSRMRVDVRLRGVVILLRPRLIKLPEQHRHVYQ